MNNSNSAISDEEEQGLVQRTPALLGLRFRDDEDRQLVRKVTIASLGLVILSMILALAHHHHKGSFMHSFTHLVLAMLLPLVGYLGAKNDSPRLIWCFHIGNVQFAVFHFVVALYLFRGALGIETIDPTLACGRLNPGEVPQTLQPQQKLQVAGELKLYNQCLDEVKEAQEQVPAKLFWWGAMTAPLWGCMMYAAYQAHEFYFRLRIRGLIARTNEGGGGTATVCESAIDSDAVE
jgi:hypothetical protein